MSRNRLTQYDGLDYIRNFILQQQYRQLQAPSFQQQQWSTQSQVLPFQNPQAKLVAQALLNQLQQMKQLQTTQDMQRSSYPQIFQNSAGGQVYVRTLQERFSDAVRAMGHNVENVIFGPDEQTETERLAKRVERYQERDHNASQKLQSSSLEDADLGEQALKKITSFFDDLKMKTDGDYKKVGRYEFETNTEGTLTIREGGKLALRAEDIGGELDIQFPLGKNSNELARKLSYLAERIEPPVKSEMRLIQQNERRHKRNSIALS